ncbi:hypothetical protein VTN96DRAFT_4476 [Rasamsonia emersonii]
MILLAPPPRSSPDIGNYHPPSVLWLCHQDDLLQQHLPPLSFSLSGRLLRPQEIRPYCSCLRCHCSTTVDTFTNPVPARSPQRSPETADRIITEKQPFLVICSCKTYYTSLRTDRASTYQDSSGNPAAFPYHRLERLLASTTKFEFSNGFGAFRRPAQWQSVIL